MIADIQVSDTLCYPISLTHSTVSWLGVPNARDRRVEGG